MTDLVNHPAHYTAGAVEAIDVIEGAVQAGPTPMSGYLQGQVLKYVLCMWLKGNLLQDAQKAQWYLNRLINQLQ